MCVCVTLNAHNVKWESTFFPLFFPNCVNKKFVYRIIVGNKNHFHCNCCLPTVVIDVACGQTNY